MRVCLIMIKSSEKRSIHKKEKKYKISQILLFGSAAEGNNYNDIDIAVKGLKPGTFFLFYGEVMMELSKPVDIINLDNESSFVNLVKREGIAIYG